MVTAESIDPSPKAGTRFEEGCRDSGYSGRLGSASFRTDHIGGAGITPNRDVGGLVADIVEAGFGEMRG